MTTTKIDRPTPDKKDLEREKIAEDTKKYLAKGGTITIYPARAFTLTEGPKKRFDGGRNDSLTSPDKRTLGGFLPPKKGGG